MRTGVASMLDRPRSTALVTRIRETVVSPAFLLLSAITLLGLVLRLPSFTDALFGDELATYVVVHGNDVGRMFEVIHSDQEVTPPLYFIFASLTQHLGDASDWLRLPALLAGVASIPLTYLLGLRTVGRWAALLGATLISLSPFLIFYSTEARAYALSLLLCLLSTLVMLRAADDDRRPGWWVVYALLASAAVYTHYTSVFLLVGQSAWALVARPQARLPLVLASVGAAALFLPWLPGYLEDSRSPGADAIGALTPFTLHAVRVDISRLAVGLPYVGVRELPGEVGLVAIGLGLVAGLGTAALTAWRRRRWRPPSLTVLIIVLAVAAPVGASLYSLVSVSVFTARNLITAWPGWALLVGAIVMASRGWVRVGAVALVISGFAIGSVMTLDRDNQRTDYDAVARYLLEEGSPGDPIVDVPLAAPGAKQSLEVALDDLGADDRRVLRVGIATLADAVAVRASGGPGQFAPVPIPPGEKIAREAVREAGGDRIFLVAGGDLSFEELRAFAQGYLADFLAALPDGYRAVSASHFPGLVGGATVYELRRR